ncbi:MULTISPECIES: malonyl-CoA decarboxylase [unclassified Ruegeria]|uniref:malonyl-CoA decarboxylase n=1 Tax=unclassified Ruegeria TaxID=2625375 RepID=UPI001488876B|nr:MULTISPECIES: malonyl-CoA decarboxylase [unclassified Ruegeria]NOD75899.1 decarboxylase [Ruegeria sp. HKCCD4332]NOD88803.1 decarboxylase [Ruegeria sp. HKCCD4318]NOE16198.1 decarboxylase [Ruegeria sp. HKCCD4318-2]NOG09868.1 malonyl-CoA decarboxylase [Ruegeria sp. HKCCD4315]
MQRNWFLGDLLNQLLDRPGKRRGRDDKRSIVELCEALLSAEGEVSGFTLASTILDRYQTLGDPEKLNFFAYLNDHLELDADQLFELARLYASDRSVDLYQRLNEVAEPRRQELLRRLNQPTGATQEIVAMRVDLLRFLETNPEFKRTDIDFVHLLRSWFNRGFLVLKQISWDTPARVLDKIVAYEAVHQINDLDDLRRRLYPPDRRCFAFFHPSMPDEPLIFVEVALTAEIPNAIDTLLSEDREPIEAEQAKVAAFYSISNCQKGLTGISFGNLLIKQVVTELSRELQQLNTFVTLSPIPGLKRWLTGKTENSEYGHAAQAMLADKATPQVVRGMAARYLMFAKREDGMPLDPVARFHLGNGAELHELHAEADLSPNGRSQSGGAMVNYLYDLNKTERHHEEFATHATIEASRSVRAASTAALATKPRENTA